MDDGQQQLLGLQRAIEQAVQEFTTEKPEENFTGHITLARIKRIKRSEAKELATAAVPLQRQVFGNWSANEVEILRSELSSAGARHTTLVRVPLQA